jgi:dihydrofolate synthase/folylpolyglutamate synthase
MLTYQQTISELFDLQQFAIKLGLDNIAALMETLKNPHLDYPVIHIAGTNGKGSTGFFLAKFLESAGLKVGLYTSPHLVDFRERIQVNGKQIDEQEVIDFWSKTGSLVLKRKATFFDTTTAMAFYHFSQRRIDVAVIETGLGGRLDSTNIVSPAIVIITPVNFDHEKQLGSTLKQIAGEKAGIIKDGTILISAEQEPEAFEVIKQKSAGADNFFYLPDVLDIKPGSNSLTGMSFSMSDRYHQHTFKSVKCRQLGSFQLNNIGLAYFAAKIYLANNNIKYKDDQIRKTLKESYWPGRLQVIRKKPNIIFDVSHNLTGIQKTIKYLSELVKSGTLHILIGLVKDKDYKSIAKTISTYSNEITITEPDTHRRLDGIFLIKEILKQNKKVNFIKDSEKAYDFCKRRLSEQNTLLVIGSHYLIGSLLKNLK